ALVIVDARLPVGAMSPKSRAGWFDEVRLTLQRCLLPEVDVLLPQASSDHATGRFFVAAFANEDGTQGLVDRIRQSFERRPRLTHAGLTVAVSYTMLPQVPPEVGAPREAILASMASSLERSTTSH